MTVMIKDLSLATELDRSAMASVRGGTYGGYKLPAFCLPAWTPAYQHPGNVSIDASQSIGQSQNVMNNNGNNVAFASGISSTVNPTQSANNSINF